MTAWRVAALLLGGMAAAPGAEASVITFSAFSGETGTPLVEYVQVIAPTRYRVTEASGNVVFANSAIAPSGNPRPGLAFVSGGLAGPPLNSAITVERFGDPFELNGFELFTNDLVAEYTVIGRFQGRIVLTAAGDVQSAGFSFLPVADVVVDTVTIAVTPGFFSAVLDNIEVTPVAAAAAIPEPFGAALLGAGICGFALLRLRGVRSGSAPASRSAHPAG